MCLTSSALEGVGALGHVDTAGRVHVGELLEVPLLEVVTVLFLEVVQVGQQFWGCYKMGRNDIKLFSRCKK